MEIEGGIKIGNVTSSDPEPGTMRYKENNFEGWNGFTWVRLGGFTIAGEMVDIDGNAYPTVKIGNQVWMAKNLRVTKYNDGSLMQIQDGQYIINYGSTGTMHYPNNTSSTLGEYGGLYDFYCVETNKLCPTGWHVPSNSEWQELTDFLGGEEVAAISLKESGSMHWSVDNSASNESGFTARGAGRWHETPASSIDFPYTSYLWTRTSVNYPYFRYLSGSGNNFPFSGASNKLRGCSVRCLRN